MEFYLLAPIVLYLLLYLLYWLTKGIGERWM